VWAGIWPKACWPTATKSSSLSRWRASAGCWPICWIFQSSAATPSAWASNPKNRELLHTLGVDTVVCGTDNLSHILEREIETDTIRQLLSLGGGTASLNEILLPENFLYAGKAIMDIPIPGDTILVSITRDTEFIIPHGNTVLLPWDHILCLTRDDSLHQLTEAWGLSDK